MQLKMKYDLVLDLYNNLGESEFFEYFSQKFKDFKLYTMSVSWIHSNEYILKFKGICGDLIVSWEQD